MKPWFRTFESAIKCNFTYVAVLLVVKQCIGYNKPEVMHQNPPQSEKCADLCTLLRACSVTIRHFVTDRDAIAVTVHTNHYELEIFLPFMKVLDSREHDD